MNARMLIRGVSTKNCPSTWNYIIMTIAQNPTQTTENGTWRLIQHRQLTMVDVADQPDYEKIEATLNEFFDNLDAKHKPGIPGS